LAIFGIKHGEFKHSVFYKSLNFIGLLFLNKTKSISMKNLLLSFFFFCCCFVEAQEKTSDNLELAIQKATAQIVDTLIAIRRDIHQYPEVAGEEERTAQIIASYLKAAGLEVRENIGGYGVVGVLETGKPGKNIAWRADIDALSTQLENDPVDFKSTVPGVRHICGHDVHTVIGLGLAHNMAALKEQLTGTYYFVFQPAEENITGANAMLEDGLLDMIQPDEFYALHLTPFPTGMIATKPNELYAHYKKVSVTIQSIDATAVKSVEKLLDSLDNVTHRKFGKPSSFESDRIGIMGSKTIYTDYSFRESRFINTQELTKTTISSYWSFSDQRQLDYFKKTLPKLLNQESIKALEPTYEVDNMSYVLSNDAAVTEEAMEYFLTMPSTFIELTGVFPGGRSDDFALFLNQVPGTYFFLGASDYANGVISMPHDDRFHVDEAVIALATQRFSLFIATRARG
jgi:metal-dependent amidase/aminoacylase/carboxypeptidase family protein